MSVNADLHAVQNFETLENLFNCIFIWCPENCPRGKLSARQGQGLAQDQCQNQGWGSIFLKPFYLYTKIEILMCQNLSDVQISYSDIAKIKYQNTENTKCGISGIWYFLRMLLIISLIYFSTSRPARVQKSFVRPTDNFHQLFT